MYHGGYGEGQGTPARLEGEGWEGGGTSNGRLTSYTKFRISPPSFAAEKRSLQAESPESFSRPNKVVA